MRVPRISLGKLFNVLQSSIGRMASWPMRNIKTFPSKQMYLYLSLVERKEAEFYHNIDRRRYLVWFKWLIFIAFYGQLMVSLHNEHIVGRWSFSSSLWPSIMQRNKQEGHILTVTHNSLQFKMKNCNNPQTFFWNTTDGGAIAPTSIFQNEFNGG